MQCGRCRDCGLDALELLKMVLLHMRQALDFRQQIDNLEKHSRRRSYVA
jgi:hypothetical protein